MRTAYEDLIERVQIEEEYQTSFTDREWKTLKTKFKKLLNEFNLIVR